MFDVVIVGGGPAGLGALSSLYRLQNSGAGKRLKLCLIDSEGIGEAGHLADYTIPSDTRAEKFLTCLDGLPARVTSHQMLADAAETLRSYGAKAAPLPLVGAFYRTLGKVICQDMISRDELKLKARTEVRAATWKSDHWSLVTQSGQTRKTLETKTLILACGAAETPDRLHAFLRAQSLTIEDLQSYCVSSDVLKSKPDAEIFERLRGLRNPSVVILGGSHSAISSAGKLLSQDIPVGEGGITIIHRSPMHVTFDNVDDAHQRGFTDFTPDDICPHSNRVYALKGFRLDSRDLLMAIQGYDDGPRETRVKLSPMGNMGAREIKCALQEADLVVSALGYTPNFVPLYSGDPREKIELNAPNFVSDKSQILNSAQQVIPNCYALGLAANYNLAGRYGETSFTGQANGLVLWHKDIGMEIACAVMEE